MTVQGVRDPREYDPRDQRPPWEIIKDDAQTTTYEPTDATPLLYRPNQSVWFSLPRYLAFPQSWEQTPARVRNALIASDVFGYSGTSINVMYDDDGKAEFDPFVCAFEGLPYESHNYMSPPDYCGDIGWAFRLLCEMQTKMLFSRREAFTTALETFVRADVQTRWAKSPGNTITAYQVRFSSLLKFMQAEHIARATAAALGYDLTDLSQGAKHHRIGAWIGATPQDKE